VLKQQQKNQSSFFKVYCPLELCLDKTFMQDDAIHMEVLKQKLGNELHKKESIL
jgi:hypothetical protein